MRKPPKDWTFYCNGRLYEYSPLEDTWYPVPTDDEVRFQWIVIYVALAIVFGFLLYTTVQAL